MGVPKFFRYISERYPCLSELVKENQIPEFDNLYLDMNGIIHNCSHPDDTNVQFRITEQQIFVDIFHYIDTLFRTIKPKKLFFMAVDGVAPRAKMNQQRGRRFRSAKEAEAQEALARQKGEKLPDTARFDSNCITPGTAFMVRLQNALKQFVQSKISSNPSWQKCRVILSGHETPGEGEHKIMEYIRYLKASPEYNPNTRHCLYGLDADLTMLGLCSHELHFSLLREEVKFGNKAKKSTSVNTTRFFLLHLGLMREYLEMEFVEVKETLPFAYDIDCIVDDWILMCYLVGNDFIPNLPNFHINTNALPVLYGAYKKVLPKLGGYINSGGLLNLLRLELFLAELGEIDKEMFGANGNLDALKGQQMNNDETFGDFGANDIGHTDNDDLRDLAQSTLDMYLSDDDDENTEECEFTLHKRDYYMKKMGYEEMTPAVLAEQAECYVRALQWCLFYYYRGVKSWCWYYPHHYAPYISDVRNFSHLKFDFDEGKPFLPFEQLLAVLPAASRTHLPEAYHGLMTNDESKVIDYYPVNFDTDLNGKKQDWEAVVLIPFIDETRLLGAMKECENMLTADEVSRNRHGPMFQYDYCAEDKGARPEAERYGLAAAFHTFCTETSVFRQELYVPDDLMVLGVSKGALRDVYFSGFPTFKHLPYTSEVKPIRVKVFDQPSFNASMVVRLDASTDLQQLGLAALQSVAQELIGRVVYVGWPHLTESKVVAVSSKDYEYTEKGSQMSDPRGFEMQLQNLKNHYMSRMGIDVGDVETLVCARPLAERKYVFGEKGRMTLEKVWSSVDVYHPIQTVIRDIKMHTAEVAEQTHVCEVFQKNARVFMVSTIYYGSSGIVVDPSMVESCGRIMVQLLVSPEPDLKEAKHVQATANDRYVNAYDAASQLGIHSSVFNMLTGTCLIVNGDKRFPLPDNTPKTNIGLQLKFPKRNEETVGYTKKFNNQYVYSKKAIDLVELYYQQWPKVFEIINRNQNDTYFETTLFPGQAGQLQQVSAWLRKQEHTKATRVTCGTRVLNEDTLKAISDAVDRLASEPLKSIKIQVRPHFLYKPGMHELMMSPDSSAEFGLFDRVVMAKESHSVPVGHKGTIVGIHSEVDPNPVRQENQRRADMFYDILFDEQFDEGPSIEGVANKRLFKVSKLHLINISYGAAKFAVNNGASRSQYASLKESVNSSNKNTNTTPRNSRNVPETPPHPVVSAQLINQEEYKKINVEDLFKVNPDSLPKPPEDWRNKMVSALGPEAAKTTQSVATESRDIVYPKAMNMCMPSFACDNPQPDPVRSTFFPQQSTRPNRPQGPQNLSRNDRNPPGQGAFIPLQASRKQAKGSEQQNNRRDERKAIRIKPSADKESNTDDARTTTGPAQTRQPFVPPNPPKSRVAARFQMPEQ